MISSDGSGEETDIFGSPNGPGTGGRPFGHSSDFAVPGLLITKLKLKLNSQSSIIIFGTPPLHIGADGDPNDRYQQVFYVPNPDDLDALASIKVEGTALAGGNLTVNPDWELLVS